MSCRSHLCQFWQIVGLILESHISSKVIFLIVIWRIRKFSTKLCEFKVSLDAKQPLRLSQNKQGSLTTFGRVPGRWQFTKCNLWPTVTVANIFWTRFWSIVFKNFISSSYFLLRVFISRDIFELFDKHPCLFTSKPISSVQPSKYLYTTMYKVKLSRQCLRHL